MNNLKAINRNYLVAMKMSNKEKYKLTDEIEIDIQKGFNFNRREDSCSFATVIEGEGLPAGADALVHHNAATPSFEVAAFRENDEVVHSIPSDFLYCYRENGGDWMPTKDFLITYRIFEEYKGLLAGIEPQRVKQRLYVVKGTIPHYEIEGKVVFCTPHSDYEIIFHDKGREASVIRTRMREVLGIDHVMTERVKNGELLIGNNLQTATFINKITSNAST